MYDLSFRSLQSSVPTRALVTTLGAVMLVVVLIGVSRWQDYRETIALGEERAGKLARVVENFVRHRLEEAEFTMRAQGGLRARDDFVEAAAASLAGALRRRHEFIAADGVVDARHPEWIAGRADAVAALRQWQRDADGTPVGRLAVGRPLRAEGAKEAVIPLALRYTPLNGGAPVFAVSALQPNLLGDLRRGLGLGEAQSMALLTNEGVLLAREPYVADTIGRKIAVRRAFLEVNADKPVPPQRITWSTDGLERFTAVLPVAGLPLLVVTGERSDVVMAPFHARSERSVLIAAFLVLIILALGGLAWRRARGEERALAERLAAEETYRIAFGSLTEGVFTVGRDRNVRNFNAATLRILGLDEAQLRDRSLAPPGWRILREDGSEVPPAQLPGALVLSDGKPRLGQVLQLATGDGATRWLEINAIPVMKEGAVDAAVVSIKDVTPQHEAAARVAELNATLEQRVAGRTRQLQALHAHLAATEEGERRQLARDLHDDISQLLAAARIRLAGLRTDGGDAAALAAVQDLIDRADRATRSLAAQLSPPVLRELGLVAALEWLVDEIDALYGLPVHLDATGGEPPLSQDARSVLYRAVRELLINVARHAGAACATVEVRHCTRTLEVCVRDDGTGFDPDATHEGGLAAMRERLALIDGRLALSRPPQGGMQAVITVPLALQAAEAAAP